MTMETYIKELDKILRRTSMNEELEKIIDVIDLQEKWLINIKKEYGFVSTSDIVIAMYTIRSAISELTGDNNVAK